jgi:hypothetical protein
MSKNWAIYVIFIKLSKDKNSPKRQKFSQSGHLGWKATDTRTTQEWLYVCT